MRKYFFILIGTILSASSYGQVSKSKWLDTPLKIDGKSSDWGDRPSYFDADSKILYELRNDSNNIYVIFELSEKTSERKFMHAGFELTLNVKSKPKIKASINFQPQQVNMQEGIASSEQPGGEMSSANRDSYLLNLNYAEIEGFITSKEIIKRNNNQNEDFTFDVGWNDNNRMIIEIKIPLTALFKEPFNIEDLAKNTINLKCTLKALERPSGNNVGQDGGMQGESSPRGGMGGGPPGGGKGGGSQMGGAGGGRPDMQTMESANVFKAKYSLSSPE